MPSKYIKRGPESNTGYYEAKDGNIHIYSTKYLSQKQSLSLSSGIGVSMSDFISIKYNRVKQNVVKNPINNVIFTSQNAVESLLYSFDASELDFNNIFCVGRRTKRLIEKKIGKVSHIESSAENLANYLAEKSLRFVLTNSGRKRLVYPDVT